MSSSSPLDFLVDQRGDVLPETFAVGPADVRSRPRTDGGEDCC